MVTHSTIRRGLAELVVAGGMLKLAGMRFGAAPGIQRHIAADMCRNGLAQFAPRMDGTFLMITDKGAAAAGAAIREAS